MLVYSFGYTGNNSYVELRVVESVSMYDTLQMETGVTKKPIVVHPPPPPFHPTLYNHH